MVFDMPYSINLVKYILHAPLKPQSSLLIATMPSCYPGEEEGGKKKKKGNAIGFPCSGNPQIFTSNVGVRLVLSAHLSFSLTALMLICQP